MLNEVRIGRKERKENLTGMVEGYEGLGWEGDVFCLWQLYKHGTSIIKKATLFCRWNCLHPADRIHSDNSKLPFLSLGLSSFCVAGTDRGLACIR